MINIGFWLRHPDRIIARLRYRNWEKQNPDKPWLCPGAVAFCDATLRKDMRAVEFGSGRSTAWYAKRVGTLLSVEDHAGWHETVKSTLAEHNCSNVDYRHIPLDHPQDEPEHLTYDPIPAYVRVIDEFPENSVDFVIVDGHYRSMCNLAAQSRLKAGGYLLVDDLNFWPTPRPRNVPADWQMVHKSTNGLKFTAVYQKPAGAAVLTAP